MAQSTEVLYLLDLLDEIDEMSIGYLWGFLHDEVHHGSLSKIFKFLDAERVKELKTARSIVRRLVEAKQEPQRELNDERIKTLVGFLQDELLDEHFTRLELQRIPGIVARWKQLREVPVVLLPGEKVTNYLRQATTCYLYGLPNAAAILCRAVLQFGLVEALERRGGMDLSRVDRKDYLKSLINFSGMTKPKVLSPELATKAHRIRKVGNDSIHQSTCSEPKALTTIKETGEVLAHIYGRTATSAR